jgi:hypothetical protein
LDEIFIPAGHVCSRRYQALLLNIAIDEVHPLNSCLPCLRTQSQNPAMYLIETCTAEVSSIAAPVRNCFSTRCGSQGPRRPRFSFFRFNFQTTGTLWPKPRQFPPSSEPEGRRSPCIRELSDAFSLFQ